MQKLGLIAAALGVPAACFYLGLEFGVANSPDYSTELAGTLFLVANLKPIQIDSDDVKLGLDAGPRKYAYSLKANSLDVIPPDPWVLKARGTEKRWKHDEYKRVGELAGISTAAAGGVLGAAEKFAAQSGRFATLTGGKYIYAAMAVIALGGGYLGYLAGYSDQADYDNPTFKKGYESKDLWRYYSERIQFCHRFHKLKKLDDELGIKLQKDKKLEAVQQECTMYLNWVTKGNPIEWFVSWTPPEQR